MHRNELPRIGCQHRRPGLRLTTFALLVAISATALAAPIGNGRRIAAAPGNSSSASAPLVAVRKSDNMLIVQGKPFFPIGIYEAPRTDAAMSRLARAGFNLCQMPEGPPATMRHLLDHVQSHGMKAWFGADTLLDFSTDADRKRQQLTELVRSVGAHPALLLWESMDEPVWSGRNADACLAGYAFLRALDPQRPLWTNHAPRNTIAELSRWNRATDIGGVDIYPVPEPQAQSDLPNKTIAVVGDECDKAIRAVNGKKPVFMVLQGFGWADLSRRAGQETAAILPTPHESRFMAYQAIVHGANGILYWGTYLTRKPSRFRSELESLVSELAALQDVLASETRHDTAAAQLLQPRRGVRLAHKRFGGHDYVILVNEGADSVAATVRVPGLKTARLKRLFENGHVPVSGQTARLGLAGHGVAALSDNDGFADPRVDFSGEWRNPPAAADPSRLREPGNLVANPGFEADRDGDRVPDGWEGSLPFTASLSDEAHGGRHSLALTGVGDAVTPLAVQRGTPLLGGRTYRFSAWIKAPPGVESRIYVEWVLAGVFHSRCLPWEPGTGRWQRVSYAFTAEPDPAGTAYVVAQVKGTGTALFDELKLEEGR